METTKPGWQHTYLRFTENFKPIVEIFFKILLLTDNAPGHPRALMEMYNELNVVFMPADIHSSAQRLKSSSLELNLQYPQGVPAVYSMVTSQKYCII